MRWTVRTSMRFRFLVAALAAALLVIGGGALEAMRVDVFPEFAPPRVAIQTACLGLSTADVEQLVTVPLEQALSGVSGLDDMRSKSVPQLSSVELIFKSGTDLLRARQLVEERIAPITPALPTWASRPVILAPASATARAMQIGMTADKLSIIDLSTTAFWTVRTRLMQVPGVANVSIWNQRLNQLAVEVNPDKLAARNVSLDEVQQATGDAVDYSRLMFTKGSSLPLGGSIEDEVQRLAVSSIAPISTPEDLARVPVKATGRSVVTLGDIGDVVIDHQPLIGDSVINGKPGLLLVVEKLPWANTIQMTDGIKDALTTLQPGLPGITFDPEVFQQAGFIELAIHNLSESLVLGFILIVVILALFLFEWRVALISLITIPLSLVATLLVLKLFDATINTMTLAGLVIALGAVVDDAIIDVENIVRRLRLERRSGGGHSTASVILHASLEVRSSIIYATLIIVAATVPVFLLQGLTGAFFRPLAAAYTIAIVASMVVALTVTPALSLILLRNARIERHESPIVKVLQRGYSATLRRITRRPATVYVAFAAIAAIGLAMVPQLGQSLFPEFKERDFLMHWVTAPGTSDSEMQRITTQVSGQLLAVPGVRSVGAHIGQAASGEEIAGMNLGEIWMSIDPSVDRDETLENVRAVADAYPGLFREVQTYLDERIEEVLTGGKAPVIVRVSGEDLDTLRAKAAQVQDALADVPGVVDPHTDLVLDVPQVDVEVNLKRAHAFGLKPGDVRRQAAIMVAGEKVGNVYDHGQALNVVVWSTPKSRSSVTDLRNLAIDTPSGRKIKLADVASVEVKPVPNVIEREGSSRFVDVGLTVAGRDLGSVVGDVNQAVAKLDFPRGTHAEVLGEYRERQSAQSQLLLSSVIAALAILLLLQTSFGRWRLTALVFITLPMALVGGVIAAFYAGAVVSLGTLVGFFTVFGIAARNSILLINHCQRLESVEGMKFGRALVVRGARERLAPILMTSLATGLALVPLVVLGARPGHEIEYPLAVVVLGGLFTSTLFNLFVVPSLYLRFGRQKQAPTAGPPAVNAPVADPTPPATAGPATGVA